MVDRRANFIGGLVYLLVRICTYKYLFSVHSPGVIISQQSTYMPL